MKVSVKYWRSSIVVVMVGMALLMSTPAVFAAANPNPGVLPPQSHPHGKTYGEWSNAWWQWAFSIPRSVNPLLDTTGANCGEGQSGSVWFLAGTFGGGTADRTCTIPAGKALFFPIANTQQDNICPVASFTVEELRQLANEMINDVTTFAAEVDNVPIQDLQKYRVGSGNPFYSVTLPQDNLYSPPPPAGCSTPAGTYSPAVSDGYYLMLAPLKPGNHTIHFNAAAPALNFTLDVTYHLTVK